MDDTYVRDMLCMREELGSNPSVIALLPTVVRSITGRERPGYFKYIQSRFSEPRRLYEIWLMDWPEQRLSWTSSGSMEVLSELSKDCTSTAPG